MFSLFNGLRESAGGELPRDDPPAQADPLISPEHPEGTQQEIAYEGKAMEVKF